MKKLLALGLIGISAPVLAAQLPHGRSLYNIECSVAVGYGAELTRLATPVKLTQRGKYVYFVPVTIDKFTFDGLCGVQTCRLVINTNGLSFASTGAFMKLDEYSTSATLNGKEFIAESRCSRVKAK